MMFSFSQSSSSFALSALSISKLLVVGMYVSFVSAVPVSGLDFKIPVFGCISKIYSRLLIKAGLGLRRDFFCRTSPSLLFPLTVSLFILSYNSFKRFFDKSGFQLVSL